MRRSLLVFPALLLVASLSAVPSRGAGQERHRGIAGTWSYSGAPAEGAMIVQQAVEPVVSRMRPDIQAAARERIAESTWLPTQIRIGVHGSRLQVALRGAERRTFASAIGQPIQVLTRAGQYAQLVQTLRPDGGLQQDFVALDGTQRNIYLPQPDGTMLLDVTLQSGALPSEIHFQLVYRRGR